MADDMAVEQLDDFEQRGHQVDIDSLDDRSFGGVGQGQDQVENIFLPAPILRRAASRARDTRRHEVPFADYEESADIADLQCAIGSENAERDWQVEA